MKPLCALALVCLLTGSAFADTEIEGAVSGEWTTEGSPYIVVDSTWVPEGERLTLREGVNVRFLENQGLYVYGTLNATGTEQDSVYIRVAEDVQHWRGLRFYGDNRTEWNYASLVCPDTIFTVDPGYSLTLNHCLVDAGIKSLAGDTYYGARSCNMIFSNSFMRSRMDIILTGGRIIADHSTFDFGEDVDDRPGFSSDGTIYEFTDCFTIGGLWANNGGYVVIYNCSFVRPPDDRDIGVGIQGQRGRMIGSYVEGGVGVAGVNNSVSIFRDNTLHGNVGFSSCSPSISGCSIGGLTSMQDCGTITIYNSFLRGCIFINDSEFFIMDSCFLFPADRSFYYHISAHDVISLEITRCVFYNYDFYIHSLSQMILDNNTFAYDTIEGAAVSILGDEWVISNNIFLTDVPEASLFSYRSVPYINYNCVWGFEYATLGRNEPISIEELDSTNIILNPLIQWNDLIPNLSPDSPCIDAGDPESPLDPDGTRVDIGAYFYDQRHGVVRRLDDVLLPEMISVTAFPNPFNSYLSVSISSPGDSPMMIRLLDLTGRTISEINYNPSVTGSDIISFDASSLASGSYYLMLRSERYTKIMPVFCLK